MARTNVFNLDIGILPVVGNPAAYSLAIYQGTFQPGSDVSAHCPTGNCTFSNPYNTLGFCMPCQDISNQVQSVVSCTFENNTVANITRLANCHGDSNDASSTLPLGLTTDSLSPFAMRLGEVSNGTQQFQVEILSGLDTLQGEDGRDLDDNTIPSCGDDSISPENEWLCRGDMAPQPARYNSVYARITL
jgi:hypothetical protein